jgi:hypothetical protein
MIFNLEDLKELWWLLRREDLASEISKTVEFIPEITEEMIEFNEVVKRYETGYLYQHFERDRWVSGILQKMKSEASKLEREVNHLTGFMFLKTIMEDERVLDNDSYMTGWIRTDGLTGGEYSPKMRCRCIKDLGRLFKVGELYEFRTKIGEDNKWVYCGDTTNLEFTEGSFEDYFIDRNSIIDSILN